MVDSLKKIYLNYIKKPWSKEENYSWVECSLFCLPFKICQQNKTATFYFCTCEPFLCKEKCIEYLTVATVKLMKNAAT